MIQWLCEKIKRYLCKHDFVTEDRMATITDDWGSKTQGIRTGMYCKKCAYHTSFWKFMK